MNVRFVVPRRADGGHRDRLWAWCRAWWAEAFPDWPIVEGGHGEGVWNSAKAINAAARGPWDVAVILDADTFCDPDRVRAGVKLAAEAGRMVLPFDRRLMLDPIGTRQLLDEGYAEWGALGLLPFAPDRNRDYASGVVIVPRPLWDEVGGEDERFVGWGGHDDGLWAACREIAGVERLGGPVFHLWHEWDPTRDAQSALYRQTRLLAYRYRGTSGAAAMRRLLAEPRGPEQVVLVCLTTGRRSTLAETVASAEANLHGPIGRRLLVVDGPPPTVQVIAARYPGWDVEGLRQPGGYGRAVAGGLDAAIASGQPWVFWLEDDFTFNEHVDLDELQAAMDDDPRLAQVSLGRQPVYPEEVAAGGFIEAWTATGHRFTQRDRYVEHAAHWTMNPMLTTRDFLAAHPWPVGAGSERRFSDDLWRASAWPVCGIWGRIGDPPRVHHADGPRAGRGY